MSNTEQISVHKFEAAGLGKAPFRVIDVVERRGPYRWTDPTTGVEMQSGAEGQPMGTCRYCLTGIATCFVILSADGKKFDVGCECVKKTGDAGLTKSVNAHVTKARKAAESARIVEFEAELKGEALRALLASLPHPRGFEGQTMLDNVEWMMKHSGNAGKMRTLRAVAKLKAGK